MDDFLLFHHVGLLLHLLLPPLIAEEQPYEHRLLFKPILELVFTRLGSPLPLLEGLLVKNLFRLHQDFQASLFVAQDPKLKQ